MGKYKKLLVAVDGSPASMHALRESFKLASDERCWITVVSVVPPYEGDLGMTGIGNVLEALRKPCEAALHEAKNQAETDRALIKTLCEQGVIHERISDIADEENAGLIIMGRRGMHNIERTLVGSTTARVIGHSRKDVLVVPDNARVGWKKIIVATDGSPNSLETVERAIDFARSYGGELTVISVVDVPAEFYAEAPTVVDKLIDKAKKYVKEAADRAVKAGIKAETLVREGEAFRIIADRAQEFAADIIMAGSHGRSGMKRLLMGSVTEKVIGYAPCPVLVVRSLKD